MNQYALRADLILMHSYESVNGVLCYGYTPKKSNSIDPDSARLDVPGDEHRILAAFEHPHRPVERRVVIRAPNRFLKGGGEVIVLVAFLEMKQG